MSGFSRPPSFNPSHPARTGSTVAMAKAGLISRDDKMKADLGIEEEPPSDEESQDSEQDSGNEAEDLLGDMETSAAARTHTHTHTHTVTHTRAPSLGALDKNSSFSASLSRTVAGDSFGNSRRAANPGAPDADTSTHTHTHTHARLNDELAAERSRLVEENSVLKGQLESTKRIQRTTVSTMMKQAMGKLRERDTMLGSLADRVRELEKRVSGVAASASASIFPRGVHELSDQIAASAGSKKTDTDHFETSINRSTSAATTAGDDATASTPLPETIEAALAEVITLRAEHAVLRDVTAASIRQTQALRDVQRAVDLVLADVDASSPAHAALRDVLAATASTDAAATAAGIDLQQLLETHAQARSGLTSGNAGAAGGGASDVLVRQLKAEVDKERARFETMKSTLGKSLEEVKATLTRTSSNNADMQSKLAAAAEEREKYRGKLMELVNAKKAADEELTRLRAQVSATAGVSSEQAVALQRQCDELRASLESVTRDRNDARAAAAAAEKSQAELASKVASLSTQLQAEGSGTASLKAAMLELQRELNAVREAASKGGSDSAALQRELSTARDALRSTQQELQSAQTALAQSKTEAEAAQALGASLQKQVATLQQEAAAAREQQTQTQQQLAAATSELTTLRGKLSADAEASAKSASVLSTLQERVAELERARASQSAANDELQKALDAKRSELAAAVTQAKADVAAAMQTVKAAAAEHEAALKQQHQAAMDTARARNEEETAKRNEQHEQRIAALNERISQLSSVSGRVAAVVGGVSKSADAVRTSTAALKSNVREAFADMTALLVAARKDINSRLVANQDAVSTVFSRYKKELAERRKLHNLVQELRGNIRVYCRARPVLPFETEAGASVAVSYPTEGEIAVLNNKRQTKTWEFDVVFPPTATNDDVFKETEPLITSAMDGYNVCIFAYGQTGSGKTFTMEGTEASRGVNYRALDTLFGLRDERKGEFRYEISMSMLEIYNEAIQDMLATRTSSGEVAKLVVREGPQGNFVPDLTIRPVETLDDVLKLMRFGYRNRTTFATNMNEHSSRSHCMVSLYVAGTNVTTGVALKGKLHLIDLAGSERVGKSGVTGDRLKEAQAINKSLSALGDVIQARAEKRGHVPYRNSTLTWLLSDSLGGDSKTLMFVNLSPVLSNAEETFCSLNFASRVRTVELGKASKHVSGKAAATGSKAGSDAASTEEDEAGSADGSVEDGVDSTAGEGAATPSAAPAALMSPTAAASTPRASLASSRGGKPPLGAPPSGPASGSVARQMLARKK